VDPYYLTTKAEELGYHPQVILAGRRINDGMGAFIAQRTVKLLIDAGVTVKGAKVGILGVTFKEDCPDIRNSRVPDIVTELRQFGIEPLIHDPWADVREVHEEYGLQLSGMAAMTGLDALVLAVAHRDFGQDHAQGRLLQGLKPGGVLVDIKSLIPPGPLPEGIKYWSL
jgi:UDP-N-acetyl-D-galactosamine dehydrogenase